MWLLHQRNCLSYCIGFDVKTINDLVHYDNCIEIMQKVQVRKCQMHSILVSERVCWKWCKSSKQNS